MVLLSTCNRVELYTAASDSAKTVDDQATIDEGPNRDEVILFSG